MRLVSTAVDGAFVVELEPNDDDRGWFGRTWDAGLATEAGLLPLGVQTNTSHNVRAGTLRGMHLRVAPSTEAKLVTCTHGAIVDVAVDLRPGSPTYLRHVQVELSRANRRALYIPPQCAHGFLTLVDDCDVTYSMGETYDAGRHLDRGLRYDDPALGLTWPAPVAVISAKDLSWPPLGAGGALDGG